MDIQFLPEYLIPTATSKQIGSLLQSCFPYVNHCERDYHKQLPHFRFLAWEKDQLVGHLGVDFRAMNLNGHPIKVFGVIALGVRAEYRKKGIGKRLLQEFESVAREHSDTIDFLFLVTDQPDFYRALGYNTTNINTTWLKIDEHRSLGIGNETITDAAFMYKPISGKAWRDGKLDMLGYMY